MKQISLCLVLVSLIASLGIYCSTGDMAGTGHEGEAVVIGAVRDSTGVGKKHILVELLPVDFNPVIQAEKQPRGTSDGVTFNPSEDNKLWAYTNDTGSFEIDEVPAGNYSLLGIDYLTLKVIYHPNITIAAKDVNTGYDTVKTPGQILVTIADTLVTQSSYLYIPGTYYYTKIDSSGVNGIKAPAGVVRVNCYNGTTQTTGTLVDSAVIHSGIISDSSNSVSMPSISPKEDTGTVGSPIHFVASGSVCKNGHQVEYRFDWGDTMVSPWLITDSSVVSRSHSWNKKGTYWVHAQARCKIETYLLSQWSSPVMVTIIDTIVDTGSVKTPRMPVGQDSIMVGTTASYMTGGSHVWPDTSVEYRFDWGDTLISSWSVDTMQEHSWFSQGVYQVRAQARKRSNPSVVSGWSAPLQVTVFDTTGYYITQPGYLEGPGTIKAKSKAIFKTGGSTCSIGGIIQYRFNWGDSTLSQWIIGATNTIIINIIGDTIFTITAADTHFYAIKGFYDIRSQARSMKDTTVISSWTTSFRLYVLDTLDTMIIDTPWVPMGPDSLFLGDTAFYTTGGGEFERRNSSMEYRFDWGDTTWSPWSTDTISGHFWKSTGNYKVRAQARRISDTSIVSAWSQPHYVRVVDKIPDPITTPRVPLGQSKVLKGVEAAFSTGGTVCIHDNVIEYRFDWYGVESAWSLDSTAKHTWYAKGRYPIRAQARSSRYPAIISAWSEPFYVDVDTTLDTALIKVPRIPCGEDTVFTGVSVEYMTGGSHVWPDTSVKYRFDWGDGASSSWSADTTQVHAWDSAGLYAIRAQAMSVNDSPPLVSAWSAPLQVRVIDTVNDTSTIKTPRVPEGPDSITAGTLQEYMTGGSDVWPDTSVEYRFDWGDSTCSSWSIDTTGEHSWAVAGAYKIRAQARGAGDTLNISAWSVSHLITAYGRGDTDGNLLGLRPELQRKYNRAISLKEEKGLRL